MATGTRGFSEPFLKGSSSTTLKVQLLGFLVEPGSECGSKQAPPSNKNHDSTTNMRPQRGVLQDIKAWSIEILWIFFTLITFAALVAVLAHYNNKPLPTFGMGLTLNTIVAILATFCRILTLYPIEQGISQLKWNWFASERRPLIDLHVFDQASRGPWNSIRMVGKSRGRFLPFSTIASATMVTGIITSFITQSAITYNKVLVARQGGELAEAPVVWSFPGSLNVSGHADDEIWRGLVGSASQAVYFDLDKSWPAPQILCSTSNCEFPPVTSLGICASMGNVTGYLNATEFISDQTYTDPATGISKPVTYVNASLPGENGYLEGGRSLSDPTGRMLPEYNITTPGSTTSDSYQGIPVVWPLKQSMRSPDLAVATVAQLFFLFRNYNTDEKQRTRAIEILWHFCVNTYNIAVENGSLEMTISSSVVKLDRIATARRGGHNSFTLTDDGEDVKFNVTASGPLGRVTSFFHSSLTGDSSFLNSSSTSLNSHLTDVLFGDIGERYEPIQDMYRTPSDETVDKATWERLDKFSKNLAQSMTTFLLNKNMVPVKGQAFSEDTYVFVRWEWISLLVIQIFLTLVFLFSVIIQTATLQMDIVKTSNLAELFALQASTNGDNTSVTGEGMDEELIPDGISTQIPKDAEAELVNSKRGWRLIIV